MALSFSTNSSILAAQGWANGSVYTPLKHNFSREAVYSGNTQDQGLNLTILADNIALLTFNASGFNSSAKFRHDDLSIASTFALAEMLFDPDLRRFPLSCVYPMSGQYDTLSRALFYVLMIFSLVFRRHIWISVAALGTAMVYAATSAVHLFALVSLFGFKDKAGAYNPTSAQKYADADFIGILPNLTASAIMLTPILLWSTTVRKYDAQSIVVWWGILIFSALACLLYNMAGFSLDIIESFAICAKDCIPEANLVNNTLPFKVYQNCSCIDFCGTLSPTAPLRKGANLAPWFDAVKSRSVVDKDGYQNLFITNIVALGFIIIYGIVGLLISRYSPDEVRNGIFRFCNSDLRLWLKVLFEGEREDRALAYFNVQEKKTRRSIWRKCKYVFAKAMATLFTLTAGATAIICPAVFISSVITNEFLLQTYPVGEHSDSVGAWGPWVGAFLVLFAAIINKWSGAWAHTIKVVLYSGWRLVKYSKNDRDRLYAKTEDWKISTRAKLFGLVITSPFIHWFWSLSRGFWTFKTTIHFFLVWWRDTEVVSQWRDKAIDDAWEAERVKVPGGKPDCRCYVCKHDEEQRVEKEEAENNKSHPGYQNSNITSAEMHPLDPASGVISTISSSSAPTKTPSFEANETNASAQNIPVRNEERPASARENSSPSPRPESPGANTVMARVTV